MFSQPKDILLSRVLISSYLHRAAVLLLVVMGSYYSTVSQCLSLEDLRRIETGLRAGSTSVVNEKLRKELIEMKKGVIDSMQTKTRQNDYSNRMTHGVFDEDSRVQTLEKTIAKKYDKTAVHFCEFLKKNGWFSKSQVGGDGAAAGFYLLKNFIPYEVQLDLIPAISIAISRNELNKNEDFASFLDRLRMRAGLKQLFGTQAFVKNDFLALAPIESERNVDARRAVYNMPPLADYMKFLEIGRAHV